MDILTTHLELTPVIGTPREYKIHTSYCAHSNPGMRSVDSKTYLYQPTEAAGRLMRARAHSPFLLGVRSFVVRYCCTYLSNSILYTICKATVPLDKI